MYRDRLIPLPVLDETLVAKRINTSDSLRITEKSFPEQPVSINRATEEELQVLPGIGPVMAKRIIDFRRENHRFNTVNDLLKVKGIGPKTLEKLKNFIRL